MYKFFAFFFIITTIYSSYIDVDEFNFGPFFRAGKRQSYINKEKIHQQWQLFGTISYELGDEFSRQELLWPLIIRQVHNNRLKSNYGPLFINDKDITDNHSERFTWLFPFIFWGKNSKKENYFGLFPLLGKIDNIVGYDSIEWFFFPFYAKTQRHGITSNHFLFPFTYWGSSKNETSFGIFPLYLFKKRKQYQSHSFLWPFIHWGSEKKSESRWFSFLPIYSQIRSPKYNFTSVFTPFFSHSQSEFEQKTSYLWPLITQTKKYKKIREKDKIKMEQSFESKSYLPFYWYRKGKDLEIHDYIYPFIRYQTYTPNENYKETRFRIFPFFDYYSQEYKDKPENNLHIHQLWPIYTYGTAKNYFYFSFPSLFFVIWDEDIHRRFSPFWTIYSHKETKTAQETTLLFNIFTHRKNKLKSKFHILGGLLGYETELGEDDIYRFLWFRL